MKFILIIVILLYSAFSFCQEPGLTIHLKLRENNKTVTNKNDTGFKVLFRTLSNESPIMDSLYYYSCYCTYADEVIEIFIVNNADTMQLRFKAGLNADQKKPLWFSNFNLDVPFMKGYFEIPSLLRHKDNTFTFVMTLTGNRRCLPTGSCQ